MPFCYGIVNNGKVIPEPRPSVDKGLSPPLTPPQGSLLWTRLAVLQGPCTAGLEAAQVLLELTLLIASLFWQSPCEKHSLTWICKTKPSFLRKAVQCFWKELFRTVVSVLLCGSMNLFYLGDYLIISVECYVVFSTFYCHRCAPMNTTYTFMQFSSNACKETDFLVKGLVPMLGI